MTAEEYLKQELSNRELWNTETDDCYQAITEIMEEYAQSNITKLETEINSFKTLIEKDPVSFILVHALRYLNDNDIKTLIEKLGRRVSDSDLEARVKELEEALLKIQEWQMDYIELARSTKVYKIAEQALNKSKQV